MRHAILAAACVLALNACATTGADIPADAVPVTHTEANGDVVTDRPTGQKLALQLTELFKRQGYQENYVDGNFDDYVSIGIGKTPMAFLYEFQIVRHALQKKGTKVDDSIAQYMKRFNRYTSMEAALRPGGAFRPKRLLARAAAFFSRQYFFQQGFRDGVPGFLFSVLSAYYVVVKRLKAWERERT